MDDGIRLIIAGGRDMWVPAELIDMIPLPPIREVMQGGADGMDTVGREWAESRGIPCRTFPADWDRHGRAAGPIRNREMAAEADGLLLIWNGQSLGSASMKASAEDRGLPIWEIVIRFPSTSSSD